jgi:hypothetical protein
VRWSSRTSKINASKVSPLSSSRFASANVDATVSSAYPRKLLLMELMPSSSSSTTRTGGSDERTTLPAGSPTALHSIAPRYERSMAYQDSFVENQRESQVT